MHRELLVPLATPGACLKTRHRRDDLARNSAFNTIAGLTAAATALLTAVLIARTLGPEGAGVVAFAVWVAYMGVTIGDPGVTTTLIRYLPELRARGQHTLVSTIASALVRVLMAALTVTVLGLAAGLIYLNGSGTSAMSGQAWLIAGLLILVNGLGAAFMAYLKGLQQFDEVAALTLKSGALQLIVVTAGVLLLGVPGALLGYVAASILPAALSFQLVRAPPSIPDEFKVRVLRFAPLSWAIMIVSGPVWYRAELFFLQLYWGMESVGLFSVGIALAGVATLLPTLMTGAVLPHFGGLIGRDAIDEMKSTYRQATRLISLVVFPTCFGMAAVAPALVPLLYGGQFEAAIPAAMIVTAGSAIVFAAGVNANVLLSFERGKLLLVSNLIGLAIMVVAGLIVIPAYGMVGAALSRVAVQTIVVGIELWLVVRLFGFAAPVIDVIKTAAAAALCAAAAYGCVRFIGGATSLLIAVPAGAAVYFASIRELGVLRPSDLGMLERATAPLPKLVRTPLLQCIRFMVPRQCAPAALLAQETRTPVPDERQ